MNCPFCNSEHVEVPTVDIGVGEQQCGPAMCLDCEAFKNLDGSWNRPRKTSRGPIVNQEEKFLTPTFEPPHDPETVEEAKAFCDGFLAGLTAYARERGDSTLRRDNELLRRLMDEQGFKTIELLERITERKV